MPVEIIDEKKRAEDIRGELSKEIEELKNRHGITPVVVGDVKLDEGAGKCKAISPVPGGVGPMTITMLLYHTTQSAKIKAGVKT